MYRRLYVILCIALLTLFYSGCSNNNSSEPYNAEHGVLDMRGWNLQDDTFRLDGSWEFYWNKLLTYDDYMESKPDIYAEIPNMWNRYTIEGNKLPGEGYATYRLHVITDLEEGTMLGFRVYGFSSAYQLSINDKVLGSNGIVSDQAIDEVGEYKPQVIIFQTPAKEFDIIIQVSNHIYARGGFWYSIHMGSAEHILKLHDNIMGKEFFILGVLFIIAIYYLTIFIVSHEFKFSLYFSCFCLFLILTIDTVGQFILFRLFDRISLYIVIYTWYSVISWGIFFLILFIHELFKSKFSILMVRIFLVLCIFNQLMITITKPLFYSRWANLYNIIGGIGVLCTIIIILIGIKKSQKDGWLNICCIVILLITYLHDILYWNNHINSKSGEIIYLGVFLCILLQTLIQTRRIKQYMNHTIATELAFLQAQIKPHFLYNAINTFVSITYYNVEQARELLRNFADYLRRCFDFREINQYVTLENELELVRAYVEIEKMRFEERLEVTFDVPDHLNYNIPVLILQPLIENAIIHGVLPKDEGGHIHVSIKEKGKMLTFMVKDDGVGMELNMKNHLPIRKSESGVGINNITKRLKSLYGRHLYIKSCPGEGTEITWSIPIKEGRKNRWI